jgi:enoyl-CoA hydratase/carnithine racemase
MDILTDKADDILSIRFNRPDKKNAITSAMYQAMVEALDDAENDSAVRVLLFAGTPQVFTAGNDIADFLHQPPTAADSPVLQFLHRLSHASKPLVAAVAGNAVGIGTTMLLHCELVYAADNASFSLPFAQLGLCPEAASSYLLPRLAGYPKAAELLLLGDAFSAAEAYDMGLVNRVLASEDVLSFAQAQAARLAALPPSSIRATKRLMKSAQLAAVELTMAQEFEQFGAQLASPEAKEAFTAFVERRRPDFSKFS